MWSYISGGHKTKVQQWTETLFGTKIKWSYNQGGLKIKDCKTEGPLYVQKCAFGIKLVLHW